MAVYVYHIHIHMYICRTYVCTIAARDAHDHNHYHNQFFITNDPVNRK